MITVELTRWNNGIEEKITAEIDTDGTVKATVEGVTGSVCGEISAFLDDLGLVTVDENTPDFYQAVQGGTRLYGQG